MMSQAPESVWERFTIVTGGPGAGKTTLLAALAAEGFTVMPEGGRAIIRDQQAIDGPALPWRDPAAFAEQMLGWDLRSWQEATALAAGGAGKVAAGRIFFDRGLPDVIGYLTLIGAPVPAHLSRAARLRRYGERVFIAPPWPEIYARDAERRQDPAEAEATFHAVAAAYRALGYRLEELPRAPVASRVRFLRERLG